MNPYNIITLQQTASTQSYLKETDGRKPLKEYTVVFTTHQTAGRGQGSHVWESEKNKNISFSLLLKPEFLNPAQQFAITKMLSLAIVDTISKYIPHGVKIKWPNDIYVGDKKICGILSQAQIIGNSIDKIYTGIGINVNQTRFLFAPNPTSLAIETGRTFDLNTVLQQVLSDIYFRYNQMKDDIKIQDEQYLSLLLYRNQRRKYIYQGKQIYAAINSVNEYGHIIFVTDDGSYHESEMQLFQFVL